MYSLKYGTAPIVRATGGLDDSIENWNPLTKQGTGFKFHSYHGEALYTYKGDSSPGMVTGQGIGGVWFVVTAGSAATGGGSTTTSTSGSSGGGGSWG